MLYATTAIQNPMLYHQTLKSLKSLSTDTKSGASEITNKALKIFGNFINHTQEDTLDTYRNKISTLSVELAQVQPSMTSLFNLSNTILHILHTGESIKEIKKTLKTYFTHYNKQDKIVQYAVEVLSDTSVIATHSRSSTVLNILKRINQGLVLICTESRPLLEGRELAKELAASRIKVTLVVDTAIFSMLKNVQYVLVGADAITPPGIVNKIGTMAIATAAKDKDNPFYVATSLHKLYPFTPIIPMRENDEVWTNPPDNIKMKNYYFDITPLSKIDKFLTEKGPLNTKQITKKLKSIKIHPQLLPLINKNLM